MPEVETVLDVPLYVAVPVRPMPVSEALPAVSIPTSGEPVSVPTVVMLPVGVPPLNVGFPLQLVMTDDMLLLSLELY